MRLVESIRLMLALIADDEKTQDLCGRHSDTLYIFSRELQMLHGLFLHDFKPLPLTSWYYEQWINNID